LIVSYSLRFVLVPFQSSGVRNLRFVLCVALRVALVGVVSIATCHYCVH